MSRSIGLVERPVKEFLLPTTRSAPFFLFFFFFSLYFYILVFLSLIPTGAFQYILKSSFFPLSLFYFFLYLTTLHTSCSPLVVQQSDNNFQSDCTFSNLPPYKATAVSLSSYSLLKTKVVGDTFPRGKLKRKKFWGLNHKFSTSILPPQQNSVRDVRDPGKS